MDLFDNDNTIFQQPSQPASQPAATAAPKPSHDRAFAICKALAIICVVISHSGAPGILNHFVFQFHVPVFFLCAGYFFKEKHAAEWGLFVERKFTRLYLPFLRWSLFFLLVHNLWFYTGLLNEEFGNAAGGVLHPYDWHAFGERLWSIVFNMSGYDEFFARAFWFFRALFVGSLLFLLCYKLTERVGTAIKQQLSPATIGWSIAAMMVLMSLWQCLDGLKMTGVAQGGFRELQGCLLMAGGYVIAQYDRRVDWHKWLTNKWLVCSVVACLAYLCVSSYFFPTSMGHAARLSQWVALPIAGVAGFGFLLWVSRMIDVKGWRWLADGLAYVGDRTLYVFAFHLLAFRVVSILKVSLLQLPWNMVGCHTVVHEGEGKDLFFLLYIVAGVALPLIWLAGYRALVDKYGLRIDWARIFNKTVGNRVIQIAAHVVVTVVRFVARVVRTVCRWLWNNLTSFVHHVKRIFAATNTREE